MMKKTLIGALIAGFALAILVTAVVISKNVKAPAKPPAARAQGDAALAQGDLVAARALYKQAMELGTDADRMQETKKRIEDINMKILLSPIIDICSVAYAVKPGDNLAKIAKEHNTTIGLIKRANNLTSDVIRPGQALKITTCTFSIVVDKSQNLLFLKVRDEVVKTYVVSTGKNNSSPIGTFTIINKLPNPTWFRAGAVVSADSPENILGSRWMGFNLKGYGIHGTTLPQELGTQVTLGCVRMKNEEVEELYDIVPEGTEVMIVD
ncbi:MAG: L,D-transpeptidase family protein [Candidatus Omnitrophota bacterium]